MFVEKKHPAFIQPDNSEVIWRYIDLEKFKSLLERRAMFFCRADRFSDPFEGSIPRIEADHRIEDHRCISQYYGNEFNEEQAKKNIKALSLRHQEFKKYVVINCWHRNKNESDGMWQLYLKSNEGIAIKTTVLNLTNAFEEATEPLYISNVRYLDYEKDIWYNKESYPSKGYNFLTPLVHKRIEFQHENELRLLYHIREAEDDPDYWKNQEFDTGLMVPVDLNKLIGKVVLPPTADIDIYTKIHDLLAKHGLNKEIEESKLSTSPIY